MGIHRKFVIFATCLGLLTLGLAMPLSQAYAQGQGFKDQQKFSPSKAPKEGPATKVLDLKLKPVVKLEVFLACSPNGATKLCAYNCADKKTKDKGVCKAATQTCVNKRWTPCEGEVCPSAEICDGLDNDCDGQKDEVFPNLGTACDGPDSDQCATGMFICKKDGFGVECVETNVNISEVCNNKDDDCDGLVDEDLSTTVTCGKGPCEHTVIQGCVAGEPTNICNSMEGASGEICNGSDDDCDGNTDEDLTLNCTTACGSGTQTCVNGNWSDCNAQKPQAEACDGKDNDCNGQIDEGLDFTNSCYTGPAEKKDKGICRDGYYKCVGGEWDKTFCVGQVLPSTEACNGKDNDCDGVIDDVELGVGGSCENYTDLAGCTVTGIKKKCSADGKVICDIKGVLETCNKKDDDCNGEIDDMGWTTCGVGACKKMVKTCLDGKIQECIPGTPTAETCNGIDDNCDGTIDNVSGAGESCEVGKMHGKKACKKGTTTNELECTGLAIPEEICNGEDDNGDDNVDEGFVNMLNTKCFVGCGVCQGEGKWECVKDSTVLTYGKMLCNAVEHPENKQAEICGNQIDDDCDCKVDYIENKCGLGKCVHSVNACVEVCDPFKGAVPEVCNGENDDCDGSIDEGFAGNSCPVTGKLGNKCAGIEVCTKEGTVACETSPETACNGIDDDCDGTIDNVKGNATQKLTKGCYSDKVAQANWGKGSCKPGFQLCTASKPGQEQWGECTNYGESSPEKCNRKDDDCDGEVDNGFADLGDACTVGPGDQCLLSGVKICRPDGQGTECSAGEGKVTATAGNTWVLISWPRIGDATSYTLYWTSRSSGQDAKNMYGDTAKAYKGEVSVNSQGKWCYYKSTYYNGIEYQGDHPCFDKEEEAIKIIGFEITNAGANQYLHTGLTNGTEYHYTVVADNGKSTPAVWATPKDIPFAITTVFPSISQTQNPRRVDSDIAVQSYGYCDRVNIVYTAELPFGKPPNNNSTDNPSELPWSIVKYATKTLNLWADANVATGGALKVTKYRGVSLALDSKGDAHIGYGDQKLDTDEAGKGIWYATNSESIGPVWGDKTLVTPRIKKTTGESNDTSIAVDSNDVVHLTFDDDYQNPPSPASSANRRLFYATNASNKWKWTKNQLSDGAQTSIYEKHHSIALDKNNRVHAIYYDGGCTGVWYTTDAKSPNSGEFKKVCLDAAKLNLSNSPIYYTLYTDSYDVASDIAVDSHGNVHIVYVAHIKPDNMQSSRVLMYVTNDTHPPGGWDAQDVLLSGDDPPYIVEAGKVTKSNSDIEVGSSSIAVDAKGDVYVTYYYQHKEFELRYATKNASGQWKTMVVDNKVPPIVDQSSKSSMGIDSNGNVHTSYLHVVSWGMNIYTYDLMYATDSCGVLEDQLTNNITLTCGGTTKAACSGGRLQSCSE